MPTTASPRSHCPCSATSRRTCHPRFRRPLPRRATTAPARSACSSSAGSGSRTTRSTAADRGPTRRSDRSSIPRMASPRARECSSATTWISAAPCASGHGRDPAAGTRTWLPGSPAVPCRVRVGILGLVGTRAVEPRFLAGGISRGAGRTHGAPPTRRPRHFAGDYMTDMSSWMQGAFESAREVSTVLHRRALTPR